MPTTKTIKVKSHIHGKCILKIDGGYFGYDNSAPYPESVFKEREKAYVFKSVAHALNTAAWISGEKFKVLPVKLNERGTT